MIPFFNIISIIALTISISILVLRASRQNRQSHLILAFSLSLLIIATLTNILERLDVASQFDRWEDIIEILYLPTLILSIHITIIQRALRKRKESESKFKAILDHTYTFIGLLDKNGNVIEANNTALEMANISFEQVMGLQFSETAWWNHSEVEKRKLKEAIKVLKKEKKIQMFETSHVDGNGKLRHVDFTLNPILNNDNELLYIVPEGRDFTALRQAHLELESHRQRLELIVKEKTKSLDDALRKTKDLNEELQASNEELQASNEELKATNDELVEQREFLQKTLEQLKNTQEQLVESEKMASLGILTAGVAHEINNPLNFIMGGITAINRNYKADELPDAKEFKASIKAIQSGVERISNIVLSLRNYSRPNDFHPAECNINLVVDDCLVMLKNQYKDRIEIIKNYADEPVVFANEGRIHQVFLNLIHNAVQAIENKGSIKITTLVKRQKVHVIIEDNGYGIEEEDLKKIFDPFFTTKAPNKGTGLGLSISKKIITDHNGQLKISSEKDEGSTVEVILPLIAEDERAF